MALQSAPNGKKCGTLTKPRSSSGNKDVSRGPSSITLSQSASVTPSRTSPFQIALSEATSVTASSAGYTSIQVFPSLLGVSTPCRNLRQRTTRAGSVRASAIQWFTLSSP
ncbi:hypothetical protein BOTBODRAFT_57210 [Botryobasidium botryosum FD-172 SS1]|uniref:Uncharacterized protein n=1 Tax=Botryobasidium botryosum (strain FD-172 SS1) TaxID=930990 RepID=A0A067MJS9_BOTB1|nr:hypothetical protein BOTBODRAFT_57210 [Botryobasidium botryosum FD-172 SS1]